MKLWGFKDCHFGQFGTINARYISLYQRVSGMLIPLRNRSKLVERSLFSTIDLLQGAKSIFCTLNGVWGDDFHKKFQILEFFSSIRFNEFNFLMLSLSVNPKKQSEHSGLRRDTSSLVVLTFDTKVTKYFCSGGFIFLQTNFDFLTSLFWRNFLISFKRYCFPEL